MCLQNNEILEFQAWNLNNEVWLLKNVRGPFPRCQGFFILSDIELIQDRAWQILITFGSADLISASLQ